MNLPVPVVALGAGRCAVGAVVFVRPTLLSRGLGTDSVTAARTAWMARMFAVRDFALGAGVLWAVARSRGGLAALLGPGDPLLRELLLLGVVCDLGDAVAVAGALRAQTVRLLPAGFTLVIALGAAAVGVAQARR